jgi:hypothetical protein
VPERMHVSGLLAKFPIVTNPSCDTQKTQASPVPQTPMLTALSLSDLCAGYLQMRFRFKLNARSSQSIGASAAAPMPPVLVPVRLVKELDRMALTLVDAFLNPGE